jgi:hypothetical protein
MSGKPPLTDGEIYELLHKLWLQVSVESGETEFGSNTLKSARVAIFALQAALLMKTEGSATEARTPSLPSEHSD